MALKLNEGFSQPPHLELDSDSENTNFDNNKPYWTTCAAMDSSGFSFLLFCLELLERFWFRLEIDYLVWQNARLLFANLHMHVIHGFRYNEFAFTYHQQFFQIYYSMKPHKYLTVHQNSSFLHLHCTITDS